MARDTGPHITPWIPERRKYYVQLQEEFLMHPQRDETLCLAYLSLFSELLLLVLGLLTHQVLFWCHRVSVR